MYKYCIVLVVLCGVHRIYTEDSDELLASPFNNRNFNHGRIHPRALGNFSASTYNDISERCIKNSVTPVTCPQDLPDDRLLPHPDDCQLFYYCVSTDLPPICRDCPANLHFNPSKKVCDHPETAGCKTLAEEFPVDVNLGSAFYTGEIECSATNGVLADLKPDPTNCTRYYVCDWGTPILMFCPEGLHFNPRLLVCDSPESALCQVNSTIPARK